MFMNAHANVVFFNQFFDKVEILYGLGRDPVEAKFLCEFKHLAPFFRVTGADHAIIDGNDFVLRELRFDLLDDFIGGVMVPLCLSIFRT